MRRQHRQLQALRNLIWVIIFLWSTLLARAESVANEENQHKQQQHEWGTDDHLAKQFLESGIHSRNVGNIAGAISALHKAVDLYQKLDDDMETYADAVYQLAETYAISETTSGSSNLHSEQYYQQALAQYAKLESPSAKLRWAHCLNRLGVILVDSYNAKQPEQIQELVQKNDFHGDWNSDEILQDVMKQLDVSIPKQAVGYFNDAADVFRSSIQENGPTWDVQQALATSLQNMAAASTQLFHIETAINALEESVLIYEQLLTQALDEQVAQALAEAFYSLADLYLQQGAYEMSKDRYRRSMDCFENFNLPALASDEGLGEFDWSDQLTEFESALEEHMSLDADDVSMYGDEAHMFGGDYSVKDPGYEGDLHTNLGSLYLAQGDIVLAASHLQQAVRKYEMLGESNTHNMATAKFNLALLYFKSSEFSKSALSHAEAIDIFRAVGTQFGPIHVEDIEDQLQEVLHSQVHPMGKEADTENDEEKDENFVDADKEQVTSTAATKTTENAHSSFEKDEATGLYVDMEYFLSQNTNYSMHDEL